MTAQAIDPIVTHLDDDIARLERQIERYRRARAALLVDADPAAPKAKVVRVRESRHGHMRDRVLHAMQHGAETHSEVMRLLGLETPDRYEVANAIRDLRDKGLIEEAGGVGEAISGRGRAPKRYRVVKAADVANAPAVRGGNGVRRAK